MIKLGACVSLDSIGTISGMGFDYAEINLTQLEGISEGDFERLLETIRDLPISTEAANVMIPAEHRVTGPNVDEHGIRTYLDHAFSRAQQVGVKVVVFGSGGARNVPKGWNYREAWKQLARFLTITEEYCEQYDIDLAIEPLKRQACNIVNLVSEAVEMCSLLDLPRIGVLGDTYHMKMCAEPYTALTNAGKLLSHIHVCKCNGIEKVRSWPSTNDGCDYDDLFISLAEANYDRRISIEGNCNDLKAEGADAFRVLEMARAKAKPLFQQ